MTVYAVREGTSQFYFGTLVDETGALVLGSLITTITLTQYDVVSKKIVGARERQNVKNLNGVTLYDAAQTITIDGVVVSYNLKWQIDPADLAILDRAKATERHVALFIWTYGNPTRTGTHEVGFDVANLGRL